MASWCAYESRRHSWYSRMQHWQVIGLKSKMSLLDSGKCWTVPSIGQHGITEEHSYVPFSCSLFNGQKSVLGWS
jgi:hypothetical protein